MWLIWLMSFRALLTLGTFEEISQNSCLLFLKIDQDIFNGCKNPKEESWHLKFDMSMPILI